MHKVGTKSEQIVEFHAVLFLSYGWGLLLTVGRELVDIIHLLLPFRCLLELMAALLHRTCFVTRDKESDSTCHVS